MGERKFKSKEVVKDYQWHLLEQVRTGKKSYKEVKDYLDPKSRKIGSSMFSSHRNAKVYTGCTPNQYSHRN